MAAPIDDLLRACDQVQHHNWCNFGFDQNAECKCGVEAVREAARRVREWRAQPVLSDAELLSAYNNGAGPVLNEHEDGLRAVERAVRDRLSHNQGDSQ